MQQDQWLTERLGLPAFTVPADVGGSSLSSHIRAQADSFYQAKVPTSDVMAVEKLESLGFRVVDVNVTLTWDGVREGVRPESFTTLVPSPANDSITQSVNPGGQNPGDQVLNCNTAIRCGNSRSDPRTVNGATLIVDAQASHVEALMRIASSEFRVSRFHLDPLVPTHVADTIKRDWVDAYTNGTRGDRLIVAEKDGEAVGFLAVLEKHGSSGRVNVIDLIAVARSSRGSGVGKRLIYELVAQSNAQGASIEVGTQISNIPSLRFYETLGFRCSETRYVLHLHSNAVHQNQETTS